MSKFAVRIILVMLWMGTELFLAPQNLKAQTLSGQVREYLRIRIESAGTPPRLAVGEELVHASIVLPRFYETRIYQPAWSDDNGPLPQADELIKAIGKASEEGLIPEDYHLAKIKAVVGEVCENQERKRPLNPRRLADLDLMFKDAYLIYASHLLAGKVNPEKIDAEWFANRREADLAKTLETALGKNRIEESLQELLPLHSGYHKLKQVFKFYKEREASGGWPVVSGGPKMQKGDRGERIIKLRRRLYATGDLLSNEESDLFDEDLEQAVHKFQRRHGLESDGVVGAMTLAAMNVPVKEHVRQIELNMERWRWLPQDLQTRYIIVNIANFELDIFENNEVVMAIKVVVGKDYRRTPVFSADMTYLVLSPFWHVPHKIAVLDKLPLIQKDISYLEKQKIRVFQGWGAEEREIDPKNIDWENMTAGSFNYRLRQDPGPLNALGSVKFMFPNKFNVYLHDTPTKELFMKTSRAFSSGCIRIEKPIELAEYLLRDDPRWTREAILAAIDRGIEQTVKLAKPITVHLLYWTAWIDEDGIIQFRSDIYGRDKKLDDALSEKSPTYSKVM